LGAFPTKKRFAGALDFPRGFAFPDAFALGAPPLAFAGFLAFVAFAIRSVPL
jgi:hypothetical protein